MAGHKSFLSTINLPNPSRCFSKHRKKKCLADYGQFPFCLFEGEPAAADKLVKPALTNSKTNMYQSDPAVKLAITHKKHIDIQYGKLQPCRIEQEDKTIYGLQNKNSDWENYAVEIVKITNTDTNTEFRGYKHYGASKKLGKPYCLGNEAFGSSMLHHDVFINEMPAAGALPFSDAEALMSSEPKFGKNLTKILEGDFVFLFACDKANEVLDYKKQLQRYAEEASKDGRIVSAVINDQEDLGVASPFGNERWTHPHYCRVLEEPSIDSRQVCDAEDECLYTPGSCKEYDSIQCSVGEECVSGSCHDDGKCGVVSSQRFLVGRPTAR